VARQRGQRVVAGGEAVHEHERQPGAGAPAEPEDLARDDVEEREAVLDLEQGLRAGHAHARAQPAVELEDDGLLERRAVLLPGLRQVVGAGRLGDRLDLRLTEHAGVAVAQPAVVEGEGLDSGLPGAVVPHLLDAGGQPIGAHAAEI
jgi:hypothetical protein